MAATPMIISEESKSEEEEDNYGLPPEGLATIEDVLRYRPRITRHTTDMTKKSGWLKYWNTNMAVRELIQNQLDYLRATHNSDIVFRKTLVSVIPEEILGALKSQLNHGRMQCDIYQCLTVTGKVVGHLIVAPGKFILHQKNSTLFPGHLLQQSSKSDSLNAAGTHGCGLKEAALHFISKGALMKMWMPAAPKSADYPAETWTFRFNNANKQMAIYVGKIKKYTGRGWCL
jgi:hypothetical protein